MVNIIKPNLAFRGSLTPINKNRVDKIVQHHMAHPSWGISEVHNYHKNSNGWAGIGYNYWIDFKGNIYQGRGMNIGAHVGGHNSHTIGVGYQGDFTKQKMPDAQLKAGIALNKWLMPQLPNVKSTSDIVGHGDLANTSCPGKNFRMNELKKGIGGTTIVTPDKPKTGSETVTKPSSGGSVVDYMKSKGMDASYSNRVKLAKQYGISGYKGTASQNATLLSKIKTGKPKPKSPAEKGDTKTNSIVTYLNSIGTNSSYNNREKLAKQHGISNYKGTAAQNTSLLSKLRGGSSISVNKPKGDQKTSSVVDYLKSINVNSSYANRKNLAAKQGIKNYSGTAAQNAKLLRKLR